MNFKIALAIQLYKHNQKVISESKDFHTINPHMMNDARGVIQEAFKWVQLAINN